MQHSEFGSVLCDDLEGWDGGAVGGSRGKGFACTLNMPFPEGGE